MTARTLIFGATGGIGSALARQLAAAGQPLLLSAREPTKLAALAAELDAEGVAGDVLVPADLERVAAAAGDQLTGLAFAVGSIDLVPLRRATPEAFLAAYALNVVAAAQAVRAALPALAAANGAVVLFSSVAAGRGFKNHAVIAAAKAGVEGLTRALAAELAPKVRVNCIAPTLTRTPLAAGMLANPAMAEGIAKAHPLARLGEAEDVAAMAAFLLGAGATYVTGQVLSVDGGRGAIAG